MFLENDPFHLTYHQAYSFAVLFSPGHGFCSWKSWAVGYLLSCFPPRPGLWFLSHPAPHTPRNPATARAAVSSVSLPPVLGAASAGLSSLRPFPSAPSLQKDNCLTSSLVVMVAVRRRQSHLCMLISFQFLKWKKKEEEWRWGEGKGEAQTFKLGCVILNKSLMSLDLNLHICFMGLVWH